VTLNTINQTKSSLYRGGISDIAVSLYVIYILFTGYTHGSWQLCYKFSFRFRGSVVSNSWLWRWNCSSVW